MIQIVAWDIEGGRDKEIIGEFESIQITDREVRDTEGTTLLYFFDECWFSTKTGNGWYDWTVEVVA